jgi:tetratricopeptide (TPR) repeat protein
MTPQNSPKFRDTELAELYRRALEQHQQGRQIEALAAYDELLALQPDQAEIHFNRGLALGELNRPHEALASIERTIALKPGYLTARRYRCIVLERLGRYADALRSYEYIITLEPNDATAHCKRGYMLERLDRLAEALQAYERAIALKPDYAHAHCAHGCALLKRGDYARALTSFEAAIALQPDYAEAHRDRGDALATMGEYDAALASYERAIALKPDYIDARVNNAATLFNLGRYEQALRLACSTQKLSPSPALLHLEARCLSKLMRYENAYAVAKQADSALHGKDIAHHELMSHVCGYTDRHAEGQHHGGIALRMKDASVRGNACYAIPAHPPGKPDKGRKVISYSLYGALPRYCDGALRNCDAAAALLPDWRCRFYVDESVPAEVLRRLCAKGAELIGVDEATKASVHPLMWRFLAADDPEVSRFLLRDADSLIEPREAAAVHAWLESDRWFHLMRDWPGHCELLLAGMWGGCTGIIPSMRAEMVDFLQHEGAVGDHPNIDQYFLRQRVWPTVRQSVLAHDSQFNFPGNQAFPVVPGAPADASDYIGANLSAATVRALLNAPDGTEIEWSLLDQNGTVFCTYEGVIRDGAYVAYFPEFLRRKIRAGELKGRVTVKPVSRQD